MRKPLKVFFCSVVLMSQLVFNNLFAAVFHADAPVLTVTLYPNQAIMTRQLAVNINTPGEHQIIVASALAEQAEAIHPHIDGGVLHSVRLQPVVNEKQPPLMMAIADKNAALLRTKQAIKVSEQMMSALATQLRDPVAVEDVESALTKLQDKYAILLDRQMQLNRELESLKAQQQWQEGKREPLYTLVFDIEVAQAGKLTLNWQTTTERAYWRPHSEWRLNTQTGRLAIDAIAQLVQQTGMDWSDVALSLAILPPHYIAQPYFQSQTISVIDPPKQGDIRPMLGMMRAAGEENIAPKAISSTPVIVNSGVDFKVQLPGKQQLSSNKTGRNISYWHGEVDATTYSALYDWAWPAETALLMAEWQMPDDLHVLPGKMTLSRDGQFVTRIEQSDWYQAGSKQSLSFGEDPQLSIKVSRPPEYNEKQGLINRDNKLSQRTVIELDNRSNQEKDVRVYSYLPVATQESIKVTPFWSPRPNEEQAQGIKGLLLWQKALLAHAQWQINTGYDVSYPEGKQLIGL